MIRPVQPFDSPAIVEIAVSSGLFSEAESDGIRTLMDDFFTRNRARGHACLLDADVDESAAGVAYFQPTPATDRTWTLLMIAVRQDRQGQDRGGALLRQVEDELRSQQQRLLLVETSGVPDFALTRAFYTKAGYSQEARVRDYYGAEDDMVLYRKDLTVDLDDRRGGPATAVAVPAVTEEERDGLAAERVGSGSASANDSRQSQSRSRLGRVDQDNASMWSQRVQCSFTPFSTDSWSSA